MKILILGKDGMLGSEVFAEFEDEDCISLGHGELDITNRDDVNTIIGKVKPEVVINCAAYTDVDGAEVNQDLAFMVNGKSPGFIADACAENNAELLHISSDYVFDGRNKSGYKEGDKKNPISIYGKSKAMGEDLIIKKIRRHYIIRTAWLYGKHGRNFVNTIMDITSKRDKLEIVNDQIGCPTYAKDMAGAIKKIIRNGRYSRNGRYGIFHITNSGSCSWYEFAKEIVKIAGRNTKINPITSEELNRQAKRPACSVLINTRAEQLRTWQEALKSYMHDE